MPTRIHDVYMSCVFEALITYSVTGQPLAFFSDRDPGGHLRISFSIENDEAYQEQFMALLAERSATWGGTLSGEI